MGWAGWTFVIWIGQPGLDSRPSEWNDPGFQDGSILMPTFKVAHIREQGQDMIIFPLNSAFGRQPETEQQDELAALKYQAHAAGLAGQAVAVWDAGGGRMGFMGPPQWQGFLRSLNLRAVMASVNSRSLGSSSCHRTQRAMWPGPSERSALRRPLHRQLPVAGAIDHKLRCLIRC